MTSEAQRIAIAQACGWKVCLSSLQSGMDCYIGGTPDTATRRIPIPDYLNDLNAMADAEKMLTMEQKERYGKALAVKGWSWDIWHASAGQRAEAFLRVKGLWV
jgi:hypothetical protein